MPTLNKDIGTIDLETPVFQSPVDRSAETAAETVGTVLKGAGEIQDNNAKNNFLQNMLDIEKQESVFLQEKKSVEDELLTAKDKSVIDQLHGRLMSLETGQRQGRLSPAEAAARREGMLRQAITEHPWLAPDFRSLSAAVKGSGSSKYKDFETPESKALDARRERAFMNGISLGAQAQIDNNEFLITQQQKEIEAAARSGTLAFPHVRVELNNMVELARTNLFSQAQQMLRTNPEAIDQTDWVGIIGNTEARLRDTVIRREAELAQQGKLMSDTERSRLANDIENGMAMLRQFTESKDKVKYLERVRSVINDKGFATVAEQNPMFALLLSNGAGEQAFEFAFRDWPQFVSNFKKRGMDSMQLAAEKGDLQSIMGLQALEFNTGMLSKGLYQRLKSGRMSDNEIEKALLNGMAGTLIGAAVPEDDKELKAAQESAHNILLDPRQRMEELGWYLKDKVFRETISKPKILNRLKKITQYNANSLKSSAPNEVFIKMGDEYIQNRELAYDPRNNIFYIQNIESKSPSRARNIASNTTRQLNLMMQILDKYHLYDSSKQEWISDILSSANMNPALAQDVRLIKEVLTDAEPE